MNAQTHAADATQSIAALTPDCFENAADTADLHESLWAAPRSVAWLRRELRRERARGRCGHWSYDLARHLMLVKDLKSAEEAARCTAVAYAGTDAVQRAEIIAGCGDKCAAEQGGIGAGQSAAIGASGTGTDRGGDAAGTSDVPTRKRPRERRHTGRLSLSAAR